MCLGVCVSVCLRVFVSVCLCVGGLCCERVLLVVLFVLLLALRLA